MTMTIGSRIRYTGSVDSHRGATGTVAEIDDRDVTIDWDAGQTFVDCFGRDVSHECKASRRHVEVAS